MRKIKHPEVHVGLSGEDGSAYVILGRVTKALRLAGLDDEIDAFMGEATSGGPLVEQLGQPHQALRFFALGVEGELLQPSP